MFSCDSRIVAVLLVAVAVASELGHASSCSTTTAAMISRLAAAIKKSMLSGLPERTLGWGQNTRRLRDFLVREFFFNVISDVLPDVERAFRHE
jgi:hypothetical protein